MTLPRVYSTRFTLAKSGRQKRGDRGMRIKVGDETLGSFLLTTQAAKGSMRVSRVK